jgi:hypothetical protein
MFLPVVGRDAVSASAGTTPVATVLPPSITPPIAPTATPSPPDGDDGTYDVRLSVSREPTLVAPQVGGVFTYALNINNAADAVDIVFVNALPADVVLESGLPDGATLDGTNTITWRTRLPANSAHPIALRVRVSRCPAGGAGLSNAATLTYAGGRLSTSSSVSVSGCR